MTHTYSVKGMSCAGCVANVRKALEAVPGVTKVEVQQHPGQAVVTMDKHIDSSILKQAVKQFGAYELNEVH